VHDRAGHAHQPVGQEQAAGVGHADQPRLGHLEEAQLVRGPEAVLHRPQLAEPVVAVALEGEHGVDQVLELAGTGQ